ncbi:MAG: hypothetical protein HFH87_17945, partial [Lachnospiraceae bacterium]|nr:hypothetical protein [Lachnospiraceae bacterium]
VFLTGADGKSAEGGEKAEAQEKAGPAAEICGPEFSAQEAAQDEIPDIWVQLRQNLTETELQALSMALTGEGDLRRLADEQGIMPEVLIDGINEKAVDYTGDSILDDEASVYEDYREQVKEMVGLR